MGTSGISSTAGEQGLRRRRVLVSTVLVGRVLAGRVLVSLLAVVSLLVVVAGPAAAHDPIFLTADQTTPDTGPYMPDGAISWALYGSVLEQGDTRGFEFDLRDGDPLVISLLIPNLSPELELSDSELPYVELESPDGSMRTITANERTIFDEPFSNTSYVTLYEENAPGEGGRYRGVVVGQAPARFSLAIGINEIFFTETERSGDRPSSFTEITAPLIAWYTTPAGGVADASQLAEGEGEIQMDLIAEAMDDGVASAPEGTLDDGESDVAEEVEATEDAEDAEDAQVLGAVTTPTAVPAAEEQATDAPAAAAETAAAPVSGDDANLSWVAPVGLAAVVVVGGAGYAATRRRRTDG